jgi:hypothetical protein
MSSFLAKVRAYGGKLRPYQPPEVRRGGACLRPFTTPPPFSQARPSEFMPGCLVPCVLTRLGRRVSC